jgi:AraC-like DNA-binding protein
MPQISPFPGTEIQGAEDNLILDISQQIPGTVQYNIKRYTKPAGWMGEDMGMLHYHYDGTKKEQNTLELRFCVTGNMYCRDQSASCKGCIAHQHLNCSEEIETLSLLSFVFSAPLLSQFVSSGVNGSVFSKNILHFDHFESFSTTIPLFSKIRSVLGSLLTHSYSGTLENIYVNAQTQMLLVYSLQCALGEEEINSISCKFLSNEEDRKKVLKAREILIQHIGEPITIKELSRKAGINECYLKKGFKELFGTTIFEFYQSQRMEHAKYLLYEKGLSVTDVSALLGYSYISHFSTAFKKHTGIKPCELLLRPPLTR